MTFKTQIAADASVFCNADEFGESATYTDSSENDTSIIMVVERGSELDQASLGRNPASVAMSWIKVADISDPQPHDTITIGSEEWEVSEILGNDGVFWKLELIRSARAIIK